MVEIKMTFHCDHFHKCPRNRMCKAEYPDRHEYVVMARDQEGQERIYKTFFLCPYLEMKAEPM